jgi:hypothetical protein
MERRSMNRDMFDRPACYNIAIMGVLDCSWSDRLEGMRIVTSYGSGAPLTMLSGELRDQPALAGVLAELHELGFTLMSVERVANAAGA